MAERTRIREIDGIVFINDDDKMSYLEGKVVVRATKDSRGKSLSMQFGNIMIEIPVEPVEDMIDIVEGEEND